jgi:hypothetical protein
MIDFAGGFAYRARNQAAASTGGPFLSYSGYER